MKILEINEFDSAPLVMLCMALMSTFWLPVVASEAENVKGLGEQVKSAWFPPQGSESNAGRVAFHLLCDGTVSNVRVIKKSKNIVADRAMIAAVNNAAPFKKLVGIKCPCELIVLFDVTHLPAGHSCKVEVVSP